MSVLGRSVKKPKMWECPQCCMSNPDTEQVCSACRYPEVVKEARIGSHPSSTDNLQRFPEENGWGCPRCTFLNDPGSSSCDICENPRPDDGFRIGQPAPGAAASAAAAGLDPGHVITLPPWVTSTWACPRCTYVCSPGNLVCEVCEYDPVLANTNPQEPGALSPPLGEARGVSPVRDGGAAVDVGAVTDEQTRWEDLALQAVLGSQVVDLSALGRPHGGEGVLFQVWAPNAAKVFVAGPFNKWREAVADYELRRSVNRPGYFIGVFEGVPRRSEYKYVIVPKNAGSKETRLWRNDPRACSLVPGRTATNSRVFDPREFKWEDQGFVPPSWDSLVLYELHIATFSKLGTFRGAVAGLDHLVDLGVTTIALMPVTQDSHAVCWGYDPVSLFAVHHQFGGPEELQYFINEAHRRGLAVIMDWIPNHMSPKNHLTLFDVVHNRDEGPYFYPDDRRNTEFGPKLNYSEPAIRSYLLDSVTLFLKEFHLDGVRVDSTVTMRRSNGGAGRPEGQDVNAWTLLQELNDLVHRSFPRKIMIAEDLQGNRKINYSLGGFDSQWDARFFSVLYTVATSSSDANRNVTQVAEAIANSFHSGAFSRVIYTENHDTIPSDRQRRIPEAIIPGSGDRNFFAIKRSVLCAAVMITSPGIPMILQGQEMLETSGPVWPHPPPMDWKRKDRFKGIFQLYSDLFALRTNRDKTTWGLTSGQVDFPHTNNTGKVLVYHRYHQGGPGDDVIVVANFSNTRFRDYRLGFPRSGTWHVRLNTDSKQYSPLFEGVGSTRVITSQESYDGFFFSGTVDIGRYSLLILSMN